MDVRKLAGDTGLAFVSQGTSLVVSAATSMLVPKVLGVEGFGYWQLFLFYGTYVGFCHLGLNDGVYLLNGGVSRLDSDKRGLNSQMWVGIAFESLVALVVALVALLGPFEAERSFVILGVALYIIIYNILYYLGFLFQAFGETRLFSRSILISRVAFVLPLSILLCFRVTDFRPYVIGQLFAQGVALVWSLYKAKDILTAGLLPTSESVRLALGSVRVGIKLMVSNIASMLVLGILRFAVDARWGIETFGQLSLSLSLINFALTFISQVGMVLFPALRNVDSNELKKVFCSIRDFMALVMPFFYALTPPAVLLLSLWLPDYSDSLRYLVWLMPICVFDAQMSILGTTYLKVLRGEAILLQINLATVAVSGLGVLIGIWFLDSFEFAVAAAVLAIALRSIAGELLAAKRMGIELSVALSVGEASISAVFILVNALFSGSIALCLYLIVYTAFLIVFRSRLEAIAGKLTRLVRHA